MANHFCSETHRGEDLHTYEQRKDDDVDPIKIESVATFFWSARLFAVTVSAFVFCKLFFQFVYLILVGIICHKA